MVKKESAEKAKHEKKVPKKPNRQETINTLLLQNFTSLQQSFTNLAIKLDNLTEQTSKLLQLFELSAKSFIEKIPNTISEIEKDREFLDKIDKLLDQNKLVAKSLVLMEQQLRERMTSPQSVAGRPVRPVATIPQTQFQQPPALPSQQGYLSSTSTQEKPRSPQTQQN